MFCLNIKLLFVTKNFNVTLKKVVVSSVFLTETSFCFVQETMIGYLLCRTMEWCFERPLRSR